MSFWITVNVDRLKSIDETFNSIIVLEMVAHGHKENLLESKKLDFWMITVILVFSFWSIVIKRDQPKEMILIKLAQCNLQ